MVSVDQMWLDNQRQIDAVLDRSGKCIDVHRADIDWAKQLDASSYYKKKSDFQIYKVQDGVDVGILEDYLLTQYALDDLSSKNDLGLNPHEDSNCLSLALGLSRAPEILETEDWSIDNLEMAQKYARDMTSAGYARSDEDIKTLAVQYRLPKRISNKRKAQVQLEQSKAWCLEHSLKPGDVIEFQKDGVYTHWIRVIVDDSKDSSDLSQILIISRKARGSDTQLMTLDEFLEQPFVQRIYGVPMAVLRPNL